MFNRFVLTAFCLVFLQSSFALNFGKQKEAFLPVDQAFPVSVDFVDKKVTLIFNTAEYYYLYKRRFEFHLEDSTSSQLDAVINSKFPDGIVKQDPYFGEVEVFYGQILITLALDKVLKPEQVNKEVTLVYKYQGCADAGLCYPPQTRKMIIPKDFFSKVDQFSQAKPASIPDSNQLHEQSSLNGLDSTIRKKKRNKAAWFSLSSEGVLEKLKARSALSILGFLLMGVLLAFTPCVLPMVPILSGIILSNKTLSPMRSGFLSCLYVLGMALTYALLGVMVAYFGTQLNLQLYLQHSVTIIFIAVLFVGLALSMFGVFELGLPEFIQRPLSHLNQNVEGGSSTGVFVMGAVSALVVSPCVSAPLAGILIYIASTGDVFYGAFTLFVLALGMGAPLLLIGFLGPKVLPKAGPWMLLIKSLLGMLLLAVSIWLLERFVSDVLALSLWIVWSLGCLYIFFKNTSSVAKVIGVFFSIMMSVLLYQKFVSTQALDASVEPIKLHTVVTQQTMLEVVQQNADEGYATIVDVYADWCVACKIMEKTIFKNADIHEQLQQVRFLKFDASDVNDEVDALFKEFQILGLPNIMLFDESAKEIKDSRILGEVHAPQFLDHMRKFLNKVIED